MVVDKNNWEVDLTRLSAQMDKICKECDYNNTDDCKPATCLIGFANKVLAFAGHKGILDIPGASKLIPTSDFKHYYPETIAPAIAESCRQCRECRDNHSNDCVISLVRSAMELALLRSTISYPGSVFMYLAQVKAQNAEISEQIATALKK